VHKNVISVFFLAFTVWMSPARAAEQSKTTKTRALPSSIMKVGTLSRSEVTVKAEGDWFLLSGGLNRKHPHFAHEYSLRKVSVLIEDVPAICGDEPNEKMKRVSIKEGSAKEGQLLIRSPSLKEGPLTDLYVDGVDLPSHPMYPGEGVNAQLSSPTNGAGGLSLTALGEAARAENGLIQFKSYSVVAAIGASWQEIVKRTNLSFDDLPQVIWIGDLDRDERADFIYDLKSGYHETRPTLYLSSMAKGSDVAGRAAQFVSVGCG
jgi:hypothetical protein